MIMNLLLLAPNIQEAILFLPKVESGRNPIHLRQLQEIGLEPKVVFVKMRTFDSRCSSGLSGLFG